MKSIKYKIRILIVIMGFFMMSSCEDFVDIETPNYKMVAQTVFSDDETAISAVKGIYNSMYGSDQFAGGSYNSVTVLAGMSSDILKPIRSTNTTYGPFWENEILPDTASNLGLWSSAYNIIYMANSVLEGAANSEAISEGIKNIVEGQALFIRAFAYFHLTNLYGDIPLILTTDFRKNAVADRIPENEVFLQIASDLDFAMELLGNVGEYADSERTNVNRYAAIALRARVHLYQEEWEKAEELSSQVIQQTSLYEILQDLDQVFLMNSREAIWQLSPMGRGTISTETIEGSVFIIHPTLPFVSNVQLVDSFASSLQPEDKRFLHWIGFHQGLKIHYPFKYKVRYSTNSITEYSMVLRLAEQYLIRAEARAMQGKLSGAMADVDKIRGRAGLDLLADTMSGIDKEVLLDVIMEERKKELFSEWGHRWLDLKRTGKVTELLTPIKPLWQGTDVLYPIPEGERLKNPNLSQNAGY